MTRLGQSCEKNYLVAIPFVSCFVVCVFLTYLLILLFYVHYIT